VDSCGQRNLPECPAQGGKIKALGITSLKRAAAAPEIPTVAESGMKGFAFVSWYGLWGPRTCPPIFPPSCRRTSPKYWHCRT
jgi:tripartite-type tricarboxylate transporter receptor subunit TctC